MKNKSTYMYALKAAFPHTIPVFAGFCFLGMAYGIYMNVSGFSFVYPMVMSIVIFGADSFLIPTMICIVVFLTIFRKPIESKEEEK